MKFERILGTSEQLFNPEGDIALSPDGKWLVNGAKRNGQNVYSILRLSGGAFVRSSGFDFGRRGSGDLRLDPAPLWSRDSRQILVPGLVRSGDQETRQLFVLTIFAR